MYPKTYRIMLGVFLAALLLLPIASFGAEDPVLVKNYGDAIEFVPQVEAADMTLTVTGPCNYKIRRSLANDGQLVFELDETTIDGMYRFEVTVIPEISKSILDVLHSARKSGDNSKVDALCREGELPGDPLIQTNGFLVHERRIVYDPSKQEESAEPKLAQGGSVGLIDQDVPSLNKDFVINDDLIVDGSACIGFDCVNGEVFSFDTIRLKENNLRIKFDDTSVVPSFPANDWQLTANDSANGGASKFSIDDISGNRTPFTVEANARSHSLYVDDGGRIGSRTSTPSTEIHTIDGDTPTLRLQQDGSSGFAPQTWDVAGNETNFFIRDVSNGSQLPFRIRPSAPTNSIFIETDGNVGIGTASPGSALHVLGGGTAISGLATTMLMLQNNGAAGDGAILNLVSGNNGTAQMAFGDVDNNFVGRFLYQHSDDSMDIQVGGSDHMTLHSSGADAITVPAANNAHLTAGGVWTDTSSREFKTNIRELSLEDALAAFGQLSPMRYNYKVDLDEEFVGFIAEDVPQLVATADRQGLSSMDIVAVLTKVLQHQQATIDGLSREVEELKAEQ